MPKNMIDNPSMQFKTMSEFSDSFMAMDIEAKPRQRPLATVLRLYNLSFERN